ncbi:zinc ribbon domain-containing protein [Bifidobacterium pullorum subsp. saeculare]|uniref:zinc ribbon domain-containing protein n=1 Tax=Bifidobacterium pullorum TaxID=78448 RepID=UPI001957D690|nr:zinc ribbon domain-containing protein [Bifidobacterium pullorum]MBM6706650.1 zinc ribbon domain-containing protein [Bifidobacterium pullorum subsp. saeculare]
MEFCRKCGTALASGAKFCTKCGTPVASPETGFVPPTDLPMSSASYRPAYAEPSVPSSTAAPAGGTQVPVPPLPGARTWEQGQTTSVIPPVAKKRRSKGFIIGVSVAVIAVVAAIAIALWWFLGVGPTRLDGRYMVSTNDGTIILDVKDGSFTVNSNAHAPVTGKVGDGKVDGDSVRYPLSDLSINMGGQMVPLAEAMNVDDSELGSALADAVMVTLTVPRGVADGNVVGEWGLSISFLTMSYGIDMTVSDGGVLSVVMNEPGYDPQTLTGTWSDLGGGSYAVNINGAPFTFTTPR